ncbi:hypothetical protein AeMF1_005816, partial [Aphanomyces euteiches]
IGMSIFYDYFFDRYRREHPRLAIVTASFNENQQLKKCVVFGSGGSSVIWDKTDFPNIENRFPKALHLYDGPPSVQPAHSKMVTFTSPNFAWLESMRKNVGAHRKLYMPVWELTELWDAVEMLNLKISFEELIERYQKLGGVQRNSIETIHTIYDVQVCFQRHISENRVGHRLLHYIPDKGSSFATLKFGSDWIGERIYNQLAVKLRQERANLMKWLDGVGKVSALNGWLFENLVHDKFLAGGQFKYIQLDEQRQDILLTVDPTIGKYERFATNFTLQMAFQNAYQIPKSQTFKSIDSFILLDQTLLLFQITTSVNHPVNCAGLVELFAKLELVDKIKETPSFAKLIFVVPQGMGDSYKQQQLISQNLPLKDLMAADVKCIAGIGPARRKKLHDKNIFTCSHLMAHFEDPEVKHEFELLTKHINRLTLVCDLSYLNMIPQYVLEIEV